MMRGLQTGRAAALLAMLLAGAAFPALAQSVPPPDIEDLIPDYAAWVAAPGPITFDSPAAQAAYQGCIYITGTTPPTACTSPSGAAITSWAYDGAGRPLELFSYSGLSTSTTNSEVHLYTIIDTQVVNTTLVGGGITAEVRIAGTNNSLGSATALTLADALAQAQSGVDLSGIRGRILPGVVTASGVVESTAITGWSSVLTGRTEAVVVELTIGPAINTIAGTGQCDATFTVCETQYTQVIPNGDSNIHVQDRLTLTTTTTIEQTVTSTGTVTIDIPIAAPGLAHAGVQVAGFDQSDRFLQRLTAPGAAGLGAAMGDGWTMFLEASGAEGDIGERGAASPARYQFRGVRGGVSHAAGPAWTLGLAVEGGSQDWSSADVFYREKAEGDGFRVGGFADGAVGSLRIGLGAFAGRQNVDTTGQSLAGAGTSRAGFIATTWGVGGSAAWPIRQGDWTVVPSLGVAVLGWSSPRYSEHGGMAPLSVDSAERTQIRPEAALDVSRTFQFGDETALTLGATGRVFAVTGDRDGEVTATDAFAAGPFDIVSPGVSASGADAGLYAGVSIGRNAMLTVAWSHRFNGSGEDGDAGQIQARFGF